MYNAEAYDAVSGSYYLRARFYEPATMRFNQPDIVCGDVREPQSLNRYAYVQNNPVMYEDPSGEILVLVGIGIGLAVGGAYAGYKYVNNRNKQQGASATTAKTTKGYTQKAKQGISWKGVVDTLMQSLLGRVGVKVVGMIVGGLTKTQQIAVSRAQKVWNEVSTSTSETVKILNKKLGQACSAFLANVREKGRTKEDIINEAVQYAIEAEDFGPLVDSEWEEYYDEDTLAEIKKRLQMYYLEHPEEHERIWEKGSKDMARKRPDSFRTLRVWLFSLLWSGIS